jgi:uncharacterized LabA/DUF88 family protein
MEKSVARTIVYIDGLNLYYRALKRTSHKWLDLEAMCRAALPSNTELVAIKYYTAHVSGKFNATAPAHQKIYLNALATSPLVELHYGEFMTKKKWSMMVLPPAFSDGCSFTPGPSPNLVQIYKIEEKGSDVNLGVHLVRDALKGRFDAAAVLTNDTDLVEPMRIVAEEEGLPLTLLSPVKTAPQSLTQYATSVVRIRQYLAMSQFPHEIIDSDGKVISIPKKWLETSAFPDQTSTTD